MKNTKQLVISNDLDLRRLIMPVNLSDLSL